MQPALPPRRFALPLLLLLLLLLSPSFPLLDRALSRRALTLPHSVVAPPTPPVVLLTVSDASFASKFRTQARSMSCYARAHGYTHVVLDPARSARLCWRHHRDFFFRKHCAVASYLSTQPPGAVAVVLDGDIAAVNHHISLARWLAYDFDLAFYERSWNFEVMSGSYVARNSRFTRAFLRYWASFEHAAPSGFSSSDNGAIHQALLDALALNGRHRCRDLYRALAAPVTNLAPYYAFVACTKRLLGPAREHVVPRPPHAEEASGARPAAPAAPAARITLFPRFFGFAVDGRFHGFSQVPYVHPFHHGLKEPNWYEHYGADRPDGSCRPMSHKKAISRAAAVRRLRHSYRYWSLNVSEPYALSPRWMPANDSCFEDLWCAPLPSWASEWPDGYVNRGGEVESANYTDLGSEWHNAFVEGLYR